MFSLVYVLHPDAAEEKVRKYRAYSSLEILRVSWEKAVCDLFYLLSYWWLIKE